ncbi:hypothetical protein [Desulfobulbus rhabdoformis]|nr:hypothetical protein [Desulfobulbus rhabdoformis]
MLIPLRRKRKRLTQPKAEIIGTEEAQKLVFSSPAKIIAGLAL